MSVQPGLCRTWSETLNTGFLFEINGVIGFLKKKSLINSLQIAIQCHLSRIMRKLVLGAVQPGPAQLICTFVFAHAKGGFLMMQLI